MDYPTLERMTGIEPALSAWEADVLPLNYIRVASKDHPGARSSLAKADRQPHTEQGRTARIWIKTCLVEVRSAKLLT